MVLVLSELPSLLLLWRAHLACNVQASAIRLITFSSRSCDEFTAGHGKFHEGKNFH